jgi:glucose/arabinose dehydrogenase
VLIGLAFVFRQQLQPLLGVNFDAGGGGRADLALPDGYEADVYAEGLSGPRFMTTSPSGVLFVAEKGADRVIALPDADGDGLADEIIEVGTGYGSAHDLAFEADGSLLVAGQETLWRVTLDGLAEASREAVIEDLPTGGHSTKSVAVLPSGEILLSIGSSCNVCDEEDERRASVQLVTDDGLRPFMVGLRNAVGVWVDPATGRTWATNMGRDLLGDDLPPETIYELIDGADAG